MHEGRRGERAWRPAIVVVASLALHAGLFFLAPRDVRPPEPVREKPVAIEIVEIQTPPAPVAKVEPVAEPIAVPEPEPEPVGEQAEPMVQAEAEPVVVDAPVAPLTEGAPETDTAAPTTETVVQRADPAPAAEPPAAEPPAAAPPGANDPGQVKLFATNALSTSVGTWKQQEAAVPGLRPKTGAHPDSPAAEAARVTGRVATTLAKADMWARVQGGFHSSCDDGSDNDIDGTIDCADPACRSRPECSNTGVYELAPWQEIPDADEIGLSSIIDVSQHGTVRKMTVRIQITHGSPGDVTLVLENMDTGATALLRNADRSDSTIAPAFYVRELQGTPAAGRWRLRVRDEFAGTCGKLKKWQLVISS